MNRNRLGPSLIALALSASATCFAGATPEATMKEFLTAMQKKDKTVLRNSIDWDALLAKMGSEEKDPQKRKAFADLMKTVYVEGFAFGKEATKLTVGKMDTKKNESTGSLMRIDPTSKKPVPATEFTLHKKGKSWLITNIAQNAGTAAKR